MCVRYLLPLLLLLPLASVRGQSCNPASVYYIVRDEKGVVLTKEQLQTIAEQLPEKIDDATVWVADVSFAADNVTYYWPESVEYEKGTKVPALAFSNAATCTLHLRQVQIKYGGKTMGLTFNVEITRHQDDRRPVVDSQKFQNGFFVLDLRGWTRERDKMIPASRWKKPVM